MTTTSIPTTRRLLLLRRAQAAAPAGAPRRYRLARLDLGAPPGKGAEDRFSYLKRAYD
jgi:hypothetical protein